MGPTPGTLWSRWSWTRHSGLAWIRASSVASVSISLCSSQRMCVRIPRPHAPGRGAAAAARREHLQQLAPAHSTASNSWVASSGSGRGAGCTRAPKRASTWASIRSVLASGPAPERSHALGAD